MEQIKRQYRFYFTWAFMGDGYYSFHCSLCPHKYASIHFAKLATFDSNRLLFLHMLWHHYNDELV